MDPIESAISPEISPMRNISVGLNRTIWDYLVSDPRHSAVGDTKAMYDGKPPPLTIGWDVEYVRQGEDTTMNRVLSYQFCALLPDGRHVSGIHYPRDGERLLFSQFVGNVVEICMREELLQRWAKEIVLCAHYSLADLPCFKDQQSLFRQVDNVRKTFVTLGNAIEVRYTDRQRHSHRIAVTLRDSKLLTPAGKASLKDLGSLLEFPKLELSPAEIGNMDHLLSRDPDKFREYAIRDAEITAHYCDEMRRVNQSLNDINKVPTTLSSLGVSFILRLWKELKIDADRVCGLHQISERKFERGRYITRKSKVLRPEADLYLSFAKHCFHGGRNEQYFFGASPLTRFTDWDLAGAYTTAMSLVGMPRWEDIHATQDPDHFQADTLGYARVHFEFPADTRFPCLPVRSDAGLIFPLKGVSFCCSPEIYLARKMGAIVRISNGVVLPTDPVNKPFAEFIKLTTTRRASYDAHSLYELFWKELANSVYGKTAQGTRPRKAYNPRTDAYEEIPNSPISSPYVASWVTSFVRAVLGEILASLPPGVLVSNATTDGILSTATKEQIHACINGPLCHLYQSARYAVAGDRCILKEKGHAEQIVGVRTRGQFTLVQAEDEKPIVAKMGIKTPSRRPEEANIWLLHALANRTADSTLKVTSLRPLHEICRQGGDLTQKSMIRKLKMDFDWKRDVDAKTVRVTPILDVDHVFFETVPWQTVDECLGCRKSWENFSRLRRILKTTHDLREFLAYRSLEHLPKTLRCPSRQAEEKILKRQFLRAYVRFQAGLDREAMTYAEAAGILTKLGLPTRHTDLENATRTRYEFIPHCLPRSPRVMDLLDKLKEEFPSLDPEAFLKPATAGKDNWENIAHLGVRESISLPVAQLESDEEVVK